MAGQRDRFTLTRGVVSVGDAARLPQVRVGPWVLAVLMLLLVHRQAQAQACELRLVVPTSAVRRVLGLMGADRVLRVFATMGEALADAPGPVQAREVKTGD
jgi:hypothetical protein